MNEVITIEIDAHTQVHVAAAVDAHGRVIDTLTVGADRRELSRMLAWIQGMPSPRRVAVEGAKGFGRALTLVLLHAGEEVLDVPTHLTAQGRRRSRRRGKNDEGDALIIARVAIQEPNLARMDAAHLNTDLKLLVDARDHLARKQAEGKSPAEVRRCLKRHLAAVVYRAMIRDLHEQDGRPQGANLTAA